MATVWYPCRIWLSWLLFSVCGAPLIYGQPNIADNESALTQLVTANQQRLVKVFGAGAGRVEAYASGIIVSPDGLIVTTQGVFLEGTQVRVVLADGNAYSATVLKRDRTVQLALLKIEAATPHYFVLAEEPVGEQGDWVVALSNAFRVADKDEPLSAMLGVVSLRTSIDARLNDRDVAYRGELILIDAITSNPGAGGGAVVTLDGRLVGVIGKIINSSETNTRLNYAIPSHVVASFVRGDLAAARPTVAGGQADLGIRLFELGGKRNPAYIDRVTPGGPAYAAGLQTDDMIISLAGERIGSIRDYETALDKLSPDQEVVIIVKRGTELLRVNVTPRARE